MEEALEAGPSIRAAHHSRSRRSRGAEEERRARADSRSRRARSRGGRRADAGAVSIGSPCLGVCTHCDPIANSQYCGVRPAASCPWLIAALMQCKRGEEVSLSLRGGVSEDGEDDEAVRTKQAIADALGTSAPAASAALEVQLVLLSWVAVEDLSDGQESLLLLVHEAGDESDYKMPKVSRHWLQLRRRACGCLVPVVD